MENEKRKLCIVGSSHATRLFRSCKQNVILKNNFEILSFTKNGANFQLLKGIFEKLSIQPFRKEDIIVIQCFGNDWIKKGLHYKDKESGIIHLRKYSPIEDAELWKIYEYLLNILEKISATVIFIDNPYRHMGCCDSHKEISRILPPYFRVRNKELASYFAQYSVLNHMKLLPSFSLRGLRHSSIYSEIMDVDKVHLKEKYYDEWAISLARQFGFNY